MKSNGAAKRQQLGIECKKFIQMEKRIETKRIFSILHFSTSFPSKFIFLFLEISCSIFFSSFIDFWFNTSKCSKLVKLLILGEKMKSSLFQTAQQEFIWKEFLFFLFIIEMNFEKSNINGFFYWKMCHDETWKFDF